ncbi:MAG TPA: hypothetical protein VKO45_01195 [Methanomicrobiales archaeon]|nr:hypothetical protein [Methanomicrobiales archaeon]
MITINNLNITSKCWKWIGNLTKDFYVDVCYNHDKKDIMFFAWYDFPMLESIIYQAIDKINLSKNWTISQNDEIIKVQDAIWGGRTNTINIGNIKYDYTTARIATLQWIFQQENHIPDVTKKVEYTTEDLQCCGNCAGGECPDITLQPDHGGYNSNRACPKWEFDGLKQEDRKVE